MQRKSPIVLTGLSAQDCAAFGSACSKTGNTWMHRPADLVLASPDMELEAVQPWVFWLYRGPWHLQAGAAAAAEWLAMHRQLLRHRADFGTRLVLINADADPPLTVLLNLGLAQEAAEVLEPAVSAAGHASLSSLLAQIFNWAAPEFWDVFEALEAASPPTGRPPVFRSSLQIPSPEQVPLLHELVLAGAQAPAFQTELAAMHQAVVQVEAERDALRGDAAQLALALRAAEASQAEQAAQLAALRSQLMQQAGELDLGAQALAEQLAAAKEARGELARLKPELAEARARGEQLASEMKSHDASLEQARAAQQQLTQDLQFKVADLASTQKLADQSRIKLADLESENDLLLRQMHQVQEELEQLLLNKRQQTADAEKTQAEQAAQVASLQAEIKQQADKLAKEVQAGQALQGELGRLKPELLATQAQSQKLAGELKSRDASLEQAQAAQQQLTHDLQLKVSDLAAAQMLADQGRIKLAELESENDLLLLQMHQGQEDLEQLFLKMRQQTADAEKAQAAQAKQVASLRAETRQQVDKIAAGVTALDKESQAGQALQAELGRLKLELAAAQAQGQKLADELKSRDDSLKQAQASAAQAQADLAARVESLIQAQSAQEHLVQDLLGKTSELEAAQQLAEQGKAKAADLESENDLLLLQMHQSQEDLEKIFLENQQLQQVMRQSSETFDRARRLISRLMLTERESGSALPLKPVAQTAAAAAIAGAEKAA